MKYIIQFSIIVLVSLIGEVLNKIISFPIPSSVIGMVLMFILLSLGIIKLEKLEETSNFLLAVMLPMFIPYSVSIIDNLGLVGEIFLQVIIISIASTVVCFYVTGKVAIFIINRFYKDKGEDYYD